MFGRVACAPRCGTDFRAKSISGSLHLLLLLGGVTPIIEPLASDTAVADGNPNIVAQNGESRDCQYFGWSSWSSCVGAEAYGVSTGVHTRKRNVRYPERGPKGKACTGPMLDAALCLTRDGTVQGDLADAAVDDYLTGAVGAGAENVSPDTLQPCMLADWGMWTGCMSEPNPQGSGSFSCGYNSETRTRSLKNAPCVLGPEVREAFTNCELEPDGTPRGCKSKIGDQGSLLESRLCPVGVCNVDCVVSEWSGFGACSKTCGTGTSRRKRALTVSPGGTGLPCPHLVESQNCHIRDCDIDCQVGDFSGWGRCVPVAGDAAVSAGVSGQNSCARNRTRPVLVKQVGTGSECPTLQEYKNCQCPDGLAAGVVGGGFWDKLKNSSSPLVKWIPPTWSGIRAREGQAQSFMFSLKDPPWGDSWWQRALWYLLLTVVGIIALTLLFCCLRCCCSCCCKKSKARKVSYRGSDSGSELDYKNENGRRPKRPSCCQRWFRKLCCCWCCCRRKKKQTRALNVSDGEEGSEVETYAGSTYAGSTYGGSKYSNGSTFQSSPQDWRSRDANLEGWKEDVPLLSDRAQIAQMRPQAGPEAWQQLWQDPALMQTASNLSTASYGYGQGSQMSGGYYGYGYGNGNGYGYGNGNGNGYGNGYGYGGSPAATASSVSSAYPARDYGQMGSFPGAMPGYDAPNGFGGAAGAAAAAGAYGNGYGGRSAYGDGPTSYGTGATYGPVVHRTVERAPYSIIDHPAGSFIEPTAQKPGYGEYSPQPRAPQRYNQAGGGAGMRPY